LAAALALVVTAAGAAGLRSPGIEPEALDARLRMADAPLVIDVRSPDQYSSEHIPGAVNVPAPTIGSYADRIRAADRPVLYCNDTRLTRMAEQLLQRERVKGFLHLEGGLDAWRERGLPLENSLPEQ